jgi:hypothetical protein
MAQPASRTSSSEGAPPFSRLNLVEHAARTAITILGDLDTAAIISFSDKAGIRRTTCNALHQQLTLNVSRDVPAPNAHER